MVPVQILLPSDPSDLAVSHSVLGIFNFIAPIPDVCTLNGAPGFATGCDASQSWCTTGHDCQSGCCCSATNKCTSVATCTADIGPVCH